MTREETIERIKVMQAYINGEKVQYQKNSGKWADTEEPIWSNLIKYRIKPESKYRPFKNAEECWKEMQKHQPFGWTYDYTNNIWDSIARVTDSGIVYEEDMMCFEDVFNREKFADRQPFGIKVEE